MLRLILVLTLWLFSTVIYPTPLVIKFNHVVAQDTPKGKAALKFKELAEKYTDGAVVVEVYPNSQLFKDREELEALQMGVIHMAAPSVSKFGPMGIRDFEIFDLPYLFPDVETVHKVTDGKIGARLFKKIEKKGLRGLAFWDNGFKHFSANKPLRNLKDFQGLKMRIQSSKVLEATMRRLRTMPQVMAFSEVYTALQQGVVDGTENPISNLYTQKMHEVQKHLTLSHHGYLVYAVVTNKKFWDNLDPTIRHELDRAIVDATAYERDIARAENMVALEAVRKSGKTEIYELPSEEKEFWRERLLPVHKKFAEKIGKENLNDVYELLSNIQ